MSTTPQEQWEKWFEEVWETREEKVYREFFGDLGGRIHTLSPAHFFRVGCREVDPRWLFSGVFESAPNERHASWLYVSSGLSNPWGDDPATINPENYSGLGMELVLMTPGQAPWAIQLLQWVMAVQILLAAGELQGDFLHFFDRVPLGNPIDGKGSLLRHLIMAEPTGVPRGFQLASGKVDLLLCVGITDREADFARTQGGPELLTVLEHYGFFPVTDPGRVGAL